MLPSTFSLFSSISLSLPQYSPKRYAIWFYFNILSGINILHFFFLVLPMSVFVVLNLIRLFSLVGSRIGILKRGFMMLFEVSVVPSMEEICWDLYWIWVLILQVVCWNNILWLIFLIDSFLRPLYSLFDIGQAFGPVQLITYLKQRQFWIS